MRPGPNGNDHFNKPLKPNRLKYGTHVANDVQRLHGKGAGGLDASAAELDAMNRGLPQGPGRKPSGPKASTGARPPNPASKQRASSGSRPPGASKVGKDKAKAPSAGPKTKAGVTQMPAKSARSVPSGKAPVPKARPSASAPASKPKAAAKPPTPKARPSSGPGRKPATPPASAAPRPPSAKPVGGTPPQAKKSWFSGLLSAPTEPMRRGPLASRDK